MRRITLIALAALITGCASYRPIVDTYGQDMSRYEIDLSDCQAYAGKVSPGGNAAAGAAIGALFGVAVSAIFGGQYMGEAAALGALQGGVGAGAQGAGSQMDIVRRCMSGRGYRVLN